MNENSLPLILETLGVTGNYLGHNLTVEAVQLLADSHGYASVSLRHTVYESLARVRGCSWQQVERNLRTAVQRAWRINRDGLRALCSYPLRTTPSVGEFLDILLTYKLRHPNDGMEK